MKKLKRIIIVLMILALVAAGGLAWLYLSLGPVIKAGIEKFGPEITQTSITVESVEAWPLTGSGTIRNLVIGNPEGYKTAGLPDIFGVVDGKDFVSETCRVSSAVNRAQRSHKMKSSAFRCVSWSSGRET